MGQLLAIRLELEIIKKEMYNMYEMYNVFTNVIKPNITFTKSIFGVFMQ